jgi:hypothetical protein
MRRGVHPESLAQEASCVLQSADALCLAFCESIHCPLVSNFLRIPGVLYVYLLACFLLPLEELGSIQRKEKENG